MIDYKVYLGPFLKCEYILEKTVRQFMACPNEGCAQHGLRTAANYCGLCGSRTEAFPETSYDANVNEYDLAGEINEVLSPVPLEYMELDEPVHIWIPNVDRDARRKFHINPITDNLVLPIYEAQRYGEQSWFIGAFLEEITLLRKRYRQCDVFWGIIVYSY